MALIVGATGSGPWPEGREDSGPGFGPGPFPLEVGDELAGKTCGFGDGGAAEGGSPPPLDGPRGPPHKAARAAGALCSGELEEAVMEFLILMALLGAPLLALALLVGALEELGVMRSPSEEDWPQEAWQGKLPWPLSLFEEEDRGA